MYLPTIKTPFKSNTRFYSINANTYAGTMARGALKYS